VSARNLDFGGVAMEFAYGGSEISAILVHIFGAKLPQLLEDSNLKYWYCFCD